MISLLPPEMCRQASKTKTKISSFSENFDAPIEFDTKKQSNFNDDQSVHTTIHCSSGLFQHYNLRNVYATHKFDIRSRNQRG